MRRFDPVPKTPSSTRTANIRLGRELSEKMAAEETRVGVTRSELIRMILEQYFEMEVVDQ
jgi:predicted DNA-binding protein